MATTLPNGGTQSAPYPEEANLRVTVSEDVQFPAGSRLEYAPTGVLAGVRLPGGELLKPWVSWELAEDDEGNECSNEDLYLSLTHDQLTDLEVYSGLDYTRTVEEL